MTNGIEQRFTQGVAGQLHDFLSWSASDDVLRIEMRFQIGDGCLVVFGDIAIVDLLVENLRLSDALKQCAIDLRACNEIT
ncbi:MAG: hypothetical protein AAB403_16625 [Planctomycetota bacterium]